MPKPEKVEVESHGDLTTPIDPPILETKVETPEEATFDEVKVEDVKMEEGSDDFAAQFNSDAMKQQMKEQVEQMKKKEKLKHDLIAGKINVEDLTDEDLANLDL